MLIWIALLASPLLWLAIVRAEWHKRRAGPLLLTLAKARPRGLLMFALFALIIASGVLIRLGYLMAGVAELNLSLYLLALNMRRTQVRERGLIVAPTRGLVPWEAIQSHVWLDDSISLFLLPEPSPWSRKMRQPVIALQCVAAQQEEFDTLLKQHLGIGPDEDSCVDAQAQS